MRTARSSSRPGGVFTSPPTPGAGTPRSRHHPCGQTHACKHITLPQTSFAGGNNMTYLLGNSEAIFTSGLLFLEIYLYGNVTYIFNHF